MPIPTQFVAGGAIGAFGIHELEKKSSGPKTHAKKAKTETANIDMTSSDSVQFGGKAQSAHGANCQCCKKQ